MSSKGRNWMIVVVMIFIAALSRFVPHWHNFTAVGAMGLFGAAYLQNRYLSYLVPFLALWFSDLILNNIVYAAYYDGFVWFSSYSIFVYAGFLGVVAVGTILLKKIQWSNILVASIVASIIFFMISNFGSFLMDPIYPKTPAGLGMAYAAGVPFFWNTLLANVCYSFLMIGGFEWLRKTYLQPARA